jgi:carboxylesterase
MSISPISVSRPKVVLLHGLASTPKEFSLMVHPLRRLGVTLLTPEVPGFTHGSLPATARWQDWVSAAADSVEAAVGPSPEPYVLGGLCTGAMLAVSVAASRPAGLRGLALLSPLFSYDGWGLPWWYVLRHLGYLLRLERYFSMHERPPYGLKNERMRDRIRQQMESEGATLVGPSQVSLQVIRESERLSRHVIALLPRLALPVLALHAREDEICRLSSVQAALSAVPSQWLQLRVIENSFHMITVDNDRQQVAEELAAFVMTLASLRARVSTPISEVSAEAG